MPTAFLISFFKKFTMKRFLIISMACLQAMLFTACHSAHNHDEHADEHGQADEHGHEHGADEISFSPEQAKAAGLQVTK